MSCPDSVVLIIRDDEDSSDSGGASSSESPLEEERGGRRCRAAAGGGACDGDANAIDRCAALQDQPLDGVPLQEFEVAIEKHTDELGVDVLQHDRDTLLVNMVKNGPVKAWNDAHPDAAVRPGDRIVEVNGRRGDSAQLIEVIRGERLLHLVIRRLLEFAVSVPRSKSLGLDVAHADCASVLKILRVHCGPFQAWNDSATFDLLVRPGDLIVKVNGTSGRAGQLLQAIQATPTNARLDLALQRGRAARPQGQPPLGSPAGVGGAKLAMRGPTPSVASPPQTEREALAGGEQHMEPDKGPGHCAVVIDN